MISSLIELLFPAPSSFVSGVQSWIAESFPELTSLDLGAALIPWDNILACIVLCVFIVCLFKFMRTVLTKLM